LRSKRLFPLFLQGARDQAILRLHGIVLPIGVAD
jgi:hypothetical protein